MFKNLFGTEQQKKELEKFISPKKTDAQLIQEIHDAYDGSVNSIMEWAEKVQKETNNVDVNKGERLAKLGFKNSEKAVASRQIIEEKAEAEESARLANHYRATYPFQKFITRAQVAEINEKYGLVCVTADRYKMDIPEKNLKEIENFIVKEEDKVYSAKHWKAGQFNFLTKEAAEAERRYQYVVAPESLYISCPKSEAILHSYEYYTADGFAQELKDPIVLQPVVGGFLIVSKWGLEASDPIVMNSIEN